MAARKTFPYCRFHATRCVKGLASLRQYHRQWDDEKKTFTTAPEHDWSSHDADAWRYLSLSWKMRENGAPEPTFMQKLLAANPGEQTFGQLKAQHFRAKRLQRELTQ